MSGSHTARIPPDSPFSPDACGSRPWPAWLMSVALHSCLLVAAALLLVPANRNLSSEADRVVGITLARRTPAATEYIGQDNTDISSDATSSTTNALPPTPQLDSPINPAISLPSSQDALSSIDVGDILPHALGLAEAKLGSRGRVGGQTRTQVFGAEGSGTRFVYVFDRSASMQGFRGRPMAAAKSQLIASLNDLDSVHQFQIVFYNEKPSVFNPDRPRPPSILFASDENKKLARGFVEAVAPAGGTQHLEALLLALNMQPDVIFFLTDAAEPQLTSRELAEIQRRNRSGAMIHTIEFGSGPFSGGDNFLVRLARQNRGQHVYVDITNLP